MNLIILETGLQIAQKTLAKRRWNDHLMVPREQAARNRGAQGLFNCADWQAGTLGKPVHCKSLLDGRVLRALSEIGRGLLVAHLPDDALRKRKFAVRARANSKVIAELPVIQVVPAALMRLRVGGHFVMRITRLA